MAPDVLTWRWGAGPDESQLGPQNVLHAVHALPSLAALCLAGVFFMVYRG